ncbi:hypothetical protein HZY97_16050 [Sphingomonas sp. R-74633]|uniref:hypothetical protein n=1 Tax=Sphingomonas sp. R-74633 TaxID=2751188 RepID=UPI0015D24639|nr:hypothetical protein [Sphingomonas sp. R-74633]NYT42285.1 hypothetical protein [Sphingomonas sp. R-74633]
MQRYIAHLIGHPAKVDIRCGCTTVRVVSAIWLIERLGIEATIEDGERRLRCRICRQYPKLRANGEWGVTGGRDQRVDPPAMPDWVDLT